MHHGPLTTIATSRVFWRPTNFIHCVTGLLDSFKPLFYIPNSIQKNGGDNACPPLSVRLMNVTGGSQQVYYHNMIVFLFFRSDHMSIKITINESIMHYSDNGAHRNAIRRANSRG